MTFNHEYLHYLTHATPQQKLIFAHVYKNHPHWTTGVQVTATRLVDAAKRAGCATKAEAQAFWARHNLL